MTIDPVDDILRLHGFSGPWQLLPATGIANRIYATADIVLRVATDHEDAVPDARTESVAAPVAHQAGILTPRLIAFDDSRTLVARPYSLWERVHGETLGLAQLDPARQMEVWRQVGQQILQLHSTVTDCPDPDGYLDEPDRELDLHPALRRWADSGHAPQGGVRQMEELISELLPLAVRGGDGRCFLHNDLHEMNIMCTREARLLALLDWGDAGWGDPVLDFAAVPFALLPAALEGFGRENRPRLGDCPEARLVWDRLEEALDDAADDPSCTVPLAAYREFLDRG